MDANEALQTDEPNPTAVLGAIAAATSDVRSPGDCWRETTRAAVDGGCSSAIAVGPDGDVLASEGADAPTDPLDGDRPERVDRRTVDGRDALAVPVRAADRYFGALVLEPGDRDRTDAVGMAEVGEYLGDRLLGLDPTDTAEDELATQRRTFRKLHSVAAQMVGAESEEGVFHLAIDAAENILRFDRCSIDVVEEGYFVPVASTAGVPESDRVPVTTGLAGRTYAEGRSFVVDDLRENDVAEPIDEAYRSMLSVPIDDVGVFQAATAEPNAFTQRDVDLAELLLSYVSQTITRIRSEDALRENELKYRTLVEQSSDAVLIVQDEGIEFANDRATTSFGHDRDDLLRMDVWDLIHPDDQTRAESVGRRVLNEGTTASFDARVTRPDGETRYFEFSVTPITFRGSDAVMTTGRDVTERKRYEEELERQNERLDEFASVVSHDLRNPLNVANGRIALARETGDLSHLAPAAEALDRMGELVEGVLQLARQGRHVDETERVGLESVVRDAWRTVDTGSATLTIEDEGVSIEADRSRLRQLFENLFRNAIDHGGESVSVTVTALDDGFAVVDDGPGIPEGEREDVFDRGYSNASEGTGFGLAIVRDIAEAHGWTIEATACERGARFAVHDADVA
ncbi:MAG: PAS domain S-box protein [Halanaeroarchaeum sp.]